MTGLKPRFALNHMTVPRLGVEALIALAKGLGMAAVEIRNDLAGQAILDGTPPAAVAAMAERHGVTILTINALQRFNHWSAEREREAVALADYAAACGAEALVLVPANDGTGRANGERQANLRVALQALKPILADRRLTGLVEPLGFETCSLRLKAEAVEAIEGTRTGDVFRLVHDTFHHRVAGETASFPALTGLVHISGVTDPAVALPAMRDPHRVLVDAADRLDNVGQIAALGAAGYQGCFSFEPFAESVHALADPAKAVRASMDFLTNAVATRALGK